MPGSGTLAGDKVPFFSRRGAHELSKPTFGGLSAYSKRQPAWNMYGTDLSKGTGSGYTCCNWSSTQAGELLSIWLHRRACEHDCWNAYGDARVGPRTALCKADYDCPAGLAVNAALLRAQKRFAEENRKLLVESDRNRKTQSLTRMKRDEDTQNPRLKVMKMKS